MKRIVNKLSRCEDYKITYALLYFLLLAPPRAFKIKMTERANQGELASFPTCLVVSIELTLRIICVLVLAACIEGIVGNTFYEIHRMDIFFVVLVSTGIVHTFAYFLIFNANATAPIHPALALLYRLVRNTSYAALAGFAAMIPVLVWNWDHHLPPYADGLAVELYLWSASAFFIVGLIEARYMNRPPLGSVAQRSLMSG